MLILHWKTKHLQAQDTSYLHCAIFFSDRKGAVEIKPHNTVCQRSNNAVALLIEICTVSVWLFAGTGRFRSFTPIKSNQNLKTPHKTSLTNYTICISYWYGILRWNIVLQHLNQGWNEHTKRDFCLLALTLADRWKGTIKHPIFLKAETDWEKNCSTSHYKIKCYLLPSRI